MHVQVDPFDLAYAVSATSVVGESVKDLRRLQLDVGNNWPAACRALTNKYASTIDYKNEADLLRKQHVIETNLLPLASDEKSNPADKLLSKINRKLAVINSKACSVCGYQCSSRAAADMSRSELAQINEVLNEVKLYPIDELEAALKPYREAMLVPLLESYSMRAKSPASESASTSVRPFSQRTRWAYEWEER